MSDTFKKSPLTNTRGRGAESNSTGRYESRRHNVDLDNYGYLEDDDVKAVPTQFFKDTSRTIITENDSPDIPFRYSMNFYRGCEHGCIYCYARPTHEYLNLSAGLDFESKIFVKEEAPQLLREKLMSPRWKPESITISGVTDCYQPAERHYKLTRQCLEILLEFRHPVALITKNQMIMRDLDILKKLAQDNLVAVFISVTTLDASLGRVLEPRTSSPQARLMAIEALAKAGVPVGVNVAPVIPGLTDHELPDILKAASEAGATSAGYTMLRLPHSVSNLFVQWLETHRPLNKDKVLNYLRDMRGGELYKSDFKTRMRGEGPLADNVKKMYKVFSEKYGLNRKRFALSIDLFRRPGDQLGFFG